MKIKKRWNILCIKRRIWNNRSTRYTVEAFMNFRSKIKSTKFLVINQKVIQSLPRNIPSFIYLRNNRFDGLHKRADRITKNAFIDIFVSQLLPSLSKIIFPIPNNNTQSLVSLLNDNRWVIPKRLNSSTLFPRNILITFWNILNDTRKREMFWQYKLDTFIPRGLNDREVLLEY